jgi:hypothetical protein
MVCPHTHRTPNRFLPPSKLNGAELIPYPYFQGFQISVVCRIQVELESWGTNLKGGEDFLFVPCSVLWKL